MFLDDEESFRQFLEGANLLLRLAGIDKSACSASEIATSEGKWSDVTLEEIDLKLIG